jgi:hypothetical protein
MALPDPAPSRTIDRQTVIYRRVSRFGRTPSRA